MFLTAKHELDARGLHLSRIEIGANAPRDVEWRWVVSADSTEESREGRNIGVANSLLTGGESMALCRVCMDTLDLRDNAIVAGPETSTYILSVPWHPPLSGFGVTPGMVAEDNLPP